MKKIFLLVLIFFLFLLIPKRVFATCYPDIKAVWNGQCNNIAPFDCTTVKDSKIPTYCCSESISECGDNSPTLYPSNTSNTQSQYKSDCPNAGEIRTAIGCINVTGKDANGFMGQILKLALGVAGGIAFLLMLFATFQIMTSAGNPEKLKAGQELITSAISGLILIIFSVFLLQLIGVKILEIPGF